jgi:transposase
LPETLFLHALMQLSCEPWGLMKIVVLDAGIASQDNLDWLKEHGYRYIVVSRERYKERPELNGDAVIVKNKTADQVITKRLEDTGTGEIRLCCHSEKERKKTKQSALNPHSIQRSI